MPEPTAIKGLCDSYFKVVKAAFEQNFAQRSGKDSEVPPELGGAVAVFA